MTLRRLITCLLLAATLAGAAATLPLSRNVKVPPRSQRIEGYTNTDSVKAWIKSRPLSSFEGIWTLPNIPDILIVSEACPQGYRLVLLESDTRILPPGTVLGYLQPTAEANTAIAHIYSNIDKDAVTLITPKTYTVSLDPPHGRLVFKELKKGIVINFWNLIPWRIRGSIKKEDETPKNLQGLVRIFPLPDKPDKPIYL